jgi:hypothetical protein
VSRDNLAIPRPLRQTLHGPNQCGCIVPIRVDVLCTVDVLSQSMWLTGPTNVDVSFQSMWLRRPNQCGCTVPSNADVLSQSMWLHRPSQCGHTIPSNAAILSQSLRLRRPNHVVVPSQAMRIYYPNQWGCTGLINVDVYPQFNGLRVACLRHR